MPFVISGSAPIPFSRINSRHRSIVVVPGCSRGSGLFSTRVGYSMSPTLFVSAFVQYQDNRPLENVGVRLWSIYRPTAICTCLQRGFRRGAGGATGKSRRKDRMVIGGGKACARATDYSVY